MYALTLTTVALTECLSFHVLVEFIKLIALSANDECEKDKKKTIAPEHVISAMDVSLGRCLESLIGATPA